MRPFSLNIRGKLIEYNHPAVMAILNVTPDSFFAGSRAQGVEAVKKKVQAMVAEGADFIDIGAYSTRPGGFEDISVDEELRRIDASMEALRSVAPDIPVSIDTFRAEVARRAVKEMSVDIINDISGGTMDPEMFSTIADLQVPYVMMHMRGTPHTKMDHTDYDNLLTDVLKELAEKIHVLDLMGINDVIIDPGLGFSKNLEQNYLLLKNLHIFEVFHKPILVGLSRKSMITKLLNIDAERALNGTTALNMAAMQQGASILRVHDTAQAVEAVKLYCQLNKV